jgi:hypothetical protein
MRIWRFFLGASLLGAGAMAVACSSSSSPPPATGGNDSGGSETSTTPPEEAAAPCVPITTASPATVDAGAQWGCYEKACSAAFTACAADCVCNNALLTALNNIATMGMTMAVETAQLTTVDGVDDAGAGAIGCVIMNESVCNPIVHPEGGDAPTGDAPSGDGATASDAPTEGG